MILVGTNTGRVYNYNINKKRIDSKFGNCEAFKRVIGLDFLTDSRDKFLSLSSNGEVLIQNIYNAFDQKETKIKNVELNTSSYCKNNNNLYLGKKDGSIFTMNLETFEEGFFKKKRNNKIKY